MKKTHIIIVFILGIALLGFNLAQIYRNIKLNEILNLVVERNKTYESYINRSFRTPTIDKDKVSKFISEQTSYSDKKYLDYIIYLPVNVCKACVSTLLADLNTLDISSTHLLFLMQENDNLLKNDIHAQGFSNIINDENSVLDLPVLGDIIIFRYNATRTELRYFIYDTPYSNILKMFMK